MRSIDQGISAALEKSPYQIEFYHEFFETNSFPDPATQQEFEDWYAHKYRERRPDLVIAAGLLPLRFMLGSHQTIFPGVPVVFCDIIQEAAGNPTLDSSFAGVWRVMEPAKTLETALHLQPDTEHVVVVGGTSRSDRATEDIVRRDLRGYESRLDITYLVDLDMPALLDRVARLPEHTVVLLDTITRDAAGTLFISSSQSGPMVVRAANAPVFSFSDVNLGHGEVGGDVTSFAEEGRIAGATALRLLNGERPQDIPVVMGANAYTFDWRALQRWGLKESNLPPGSVVLNRELTFWQAYEDYIVPGILLLLAQASIIIGLLWQRAKRKKTTTELAYSNMRLRLATESGKSVGWEWDLATGCEVWFGDLRNVFGIQSDTFTGRVGDIFRHVHPEDRERVSQAVDAARRNHGYYSEECRIIRSDGIARWVLSRGTFEYGADDRATRMSGLAVDITETKRTQAALQESEERFRLVANRAPVMIWMSGVDKLCTYSNQFWLDFTGRSHDQETGNGWAEGVHPDDLPRCLDTYTKSFDQREPFQMEYRLRRHDGEYRWILDSGVPRFNADGGFAGYIGSGIDVTDRKLAEEALSTVGRKLIEAHEEERTRIARELHDDINQRIALLAVHLDHLRQDPHASAAMLRQGAEEANKQLWDLGREVQALSHRLHSSKLELLGLAPAAAGFCRELSDQQRVEIDFHAEGVPKDLPQEVSLCLFRVLQEALQNATKYSGSRHFQVSLSGGLREIQLVVRDSGIGFDPEEAMKGRGLGLTSMQERLKLVNGDFSIDSQLQHGTTIRARVPLRPQAKSAGAAG